jgi:hypothetical protein
LIVSVKAERIELFIEDQAVLRSPTPPERRHGSTRVLQAMTSLHDVARDGVLCTFNNRCTLNNRSAPDRGKCMVWSVHHVQNHTLLGHSSSQLGGPPCWTSPLAFGLIGLCTFSSFLSVKYLPFSVFLCVAVSSSLKGEREGGGGCGAESYDRKKAWPSVTYSLIGFHARPFPSIMSVNCLSFSVFLCVAVSAYGRERGRAWSRTIRPQESLGFYKSFNPL